jgi:hypothetical protein
MANTNTSEQTERVMVLRTMATVMKHQGGVRPDTEQIMGYVLFLQDIPLDTLKAACCWCIDNRTWYPSVAEIREAVREADVGNRPASAIEAWGDVIKAISSHGHLKQPQFENPVTQTVVDSIGWRQICMTPEADISYMITRFTKSYEQLAMRSENDTRISLTADSKSDPFNVIAGIAKQKALTQK